jgi:dihydroxy-acid dehydratase
MTVSGRTVSDNIKNAQVHDKKVIMPREQPLSESGGTFVLQGNLSPNGCVIKPVAADPRLRRHTGPAVVFEDYNDMDARLNNPDLDVTADSVLVLKSAGPLGAPGFPEWGMLPLPNKLLKQGIRDMVRISDARMSGTSYGTCVLHVSPESHVGGNLALVQTGDPIELDVDARSLQLKVDESELQQRRDRWVAPPPKYNRGYGLLYSKHVTQAHEGCDFDFLQGGKNTAEPEIH